MLTEPRTAVEIAGDLRVCDDADSFSYLALHRVKPGLWTVERTTSQDGECIALQMVLETPARWAKRGRFTTHRDTCLILAAQDHGDLVACSTPLGGCMFDVAAGYDTGQRVVALRVDFLI